MKGRLETFESSAIQSVNQSCALTQHADVLMGKGDNISDP